MATPNTFQSPVTVYNKKITFSTTDLSNGTSFIEPHLVNMETGYQFNPITIGSRILVPMTSNVSIGSYWIIFHLPPNPGSSDMYVTFARKTAPASNNINSYKQYPNEGISSGCRTALRTLIATSLPPVLNVNQSYVGEIEFLFKVYGANTNLISSSQDLKVRFRATYANAANANTATPAVL
jgi:hypothetical protein